MEIGCTELQLACKSQFTDAVDTVDILLKTGATVNEQNHDGWTALHYAAMYNPEVVQILLENGADVKILNRYGWSPLHYASSLPETDAVNALLKKGAHVNIKNSDGDTPLHIATKSNRPETVRLLLINGADANNQNNRGQKPFPLYIGKPTRVPTKYDDAVLYSKIPEHFEIEAKHIECATALFLHGAELPKTEMENTGKLAKIIRVLNKVNRNCVLDFSTFEIDNENLRLKLSKIPDSIKYEACFIRSKNLKDIPNLKEIKQLQHLKIIIIACESVVEIKGLPDNLEVLYFNAYLKTMTNDCFGSDKVFDAVTEENFQWLMQMKKPPVEVLKRGRKEVMIYFANEHQAMNSRNRLVFVGYTTAGKTSLVRSLIKGKPDPTDQADRTQVADFKEWQINENECFFIIDQGGHPVYEICNPYFITERSTILITHNLSSSITSSKTLQVFRQIIHQHPGNEQVHFVLTHVDNLGRKQAEYFKGQFEKKVNGLLKNEIDHIERLISGPKVLHIENLERTLLGCNQKLKYAKYFMVSSTTFQGIPALKAYLLENAEKQRVSVPQKWILLYHKLKTSCSNFLPLSSVMKYFAVEDDKVKLDLTTSEDFNACLHYLNDTGLVLWKDQHPVLKEYLFFNHDFLISLFKSLFHHDLKSSLNFTENKLLQSKFGESELNRTIKQYQDHGLLKHKLLSFLWEKYNLEVEDEFVLIKLIKMFHIFNEISPSSDILSQLYFVPWLVEQNAPPESLDINHPMVFTKDTVTFTLQCLFYNQIPLNVTEMFCIELQRYAVDNQYLGKRYAWADGLKVKVGPIEIYSFRNHSKSSVYLSIQSKILSLATAWSSFKGIYESLQSILKPCLGVVRSLHILCAHCIMQQIDPPYCWLPDEVFPPVCNVNQYVTCENDEETIIPAALITYPDEKCMASQIEDVDKFLTSVFIEKDNRQKTQMTGKIHSPSIQKENILIDQDKPDVLIERSLTEHQKAITDAIKQQQHQLTEHMTKEHRILSEQMYRQDKVISDQIHLLSGEASHYPLKCSHPILSKHQQNLLDHMKVNEDLLVSLIGKCVITSDHKNVIQKEKTVEGKVKQLLVHVDNCVRLEPNKITDFIDALNESDVHSTNYTLADRLKETLNEYTK